MSGREEVSRKEERGERGGKSSRLDEEYRSRQGATDRGGLGRDADMEEDAEDQTLAADSQGEKLCESESVVGEERSGRRGLSTGKARDRASPGKTFGEKERQTQLTQDPVREPQRGRRERWETQAQQMEAAVKGKRTTSQQEAGRTQAWGQRGQ